MVETPCNASNRGNNQSRRLADDVECQQFPPVGGPHCTSDRSFHCLTLPTHCGAMATGHCTVLAVRSGVELFSLPAQQHHRLTDVDGTVAAVYVFLQSTFYVGPESIPQ